MLSVGSTVFHEVDKKAQRLQCIPKKQMKKMQDILVSDLATPFTLTNTRTSNLLSSATHLGSYERSEREGRREEEKKQRG